MCGKLCHGFSVNGLRGKGIISLDFFIFGQFICLENFVFIPLDLLNMEVQLAILFDLWKQKSEKVLVYGNRIVFKYAEVGKKRFYSDQKRTAQQYSIY